MFRTMVLHTVNMDRIAGCERWYWQLHGPQLARRYGPWLARFESFRALPAPAGAERFGATNWLATSGYWREAPLTGPRGEMALSTPPEHAYSYGICVPPQCTEDFKGSEWAPEEKAPIRWVQLFRWPEGVSREEGDAWYLNTFAPEACARPELLRFFSFRALEEEIRLPGEWKPGTEHLMKGDPHRDHSWDRMSELWFETFSDWEKFISAPFTAPAWAAGERLPFLPEGDMVSAFLLERPAYDWIREHRGWL